MATPRADVYAALSGETVQGGRFPGGGVSGSAWLNVMETAGSLGPNLSEAVGDLTVGDLMVGGTMEGQEVVPNDVVSNVWTPTKNASGFIKNGSWANLPANTWCRVAGTKLNQLYTPLAAAGYVPSSDDYGNSKDISNLFRDWSGGVLAGSDFITGLSGGHFDSSNNGLYRLELERMGSNAGWAVEAMPSDPDAAGTAWSSTYKDTRTNGGYTFTEYRPGLAGSDAYLQDMLPDGKPTARHTYGGSWYDPVRNEVGFSRISKWVWNRSSQQWARTRWTLNGTIQQPTINSHLWYVPQNDEVVGHYADSDTDYYTWQRHAASGAARVGAPSVSTLKFDGQTFGTRISDTSLLLVWWDADTYATERWGVYNTVARTWTTGSVANPYQAPAYTYQECAPFVYIPAWGKIIQRGTDGTDRGVWRQFDVATKTRESYTPVGNVPPYQAYPGRNYLLYTRPNGDQIFVAIAPPDDATDCVYVMRCV